MISLSGMELSVKAASVQDILPWRELYRREMNCQIVHDSLHSRKGWTQSYLLSAGGAAAGYGSIAVGGPWTGNPTVFEFCVVPHHRTRVFDFFSALLLASSATRIEIQSNDTLICVMLHAFAHSVTSESILFHDQLTTAHSPPDAIVRRATAEDAEQILQQQLDSEAKWVVVVQGTIAAAGDILFHYNRPYGDIYMKVAEPFRRRGLGSVPGPRVEEGVLRASECPGGALQSQEHRLRKTLQKAGFVPCGHILTGSVIA